MSRSTVLKPPSPLPETIDRPSVFLAGAIDLSAAEDWQREAELALAEEDAILFNPRRDYFDPSWPQRADFPPFAEQVNWELDALERAGVVARYFPVGSKAPISFLEFGLYARSERLVVAAPEGFYRRGNLEITALRYGIPLFESLSELVSEVRARIRSGRA